MALKQIYLGEKQVLDQTSLSWSTLFPHDTTTIIGSQTFIKQITALTLSCITHIRGVFPEYAFEDKILDDRKLKVIKGQNDCKNAYLLTRWIKSAFKALDLQYMQSLILEILTVDSRPVEYYAIDYIYSNNGATCSFRANHDKQKAVHFSNASIENSTKKMIFALLDATEGLGELPAAYTLQLRIHYYDDRTPISYTPDYFIEAPARDWSGVLDLRTIKLGTVNTNHHSICLTSGSTLVPSDGSEQPLFNFPNEIQYNNNEQYESSNYAHYPEHSYWQAQDLCTVIQSSEENMECDDCKENISPVPPPSYFPNSIATNIEEINTPPIISEDEITILKENIVNRGGYESAVQADEEVKQMGCLCSIPFQENNVFQCSACNYWQHRLCYKLWPGTRRMEGINCFTCAKANNLTCADENLMSCTENQAKNLMIFRQILYMYQNHKKLTTADVANDFNLPGKLAKKFVKKLLSESVVKISTSGEEDVYNIQTQKLRQFLQNYFHY